MKKLTFRLLFVLVVVVAILMLVVSWTLSSKLLYPTNKCREEHYIYCKGPEGIPLTYETVKFETDDGVQLEGWYIPAENAQKSIVLVHGHGGNRKEGLRFSSALHNAGYNLLLFNLRVWSPNKDKAFASMGYHEVKDVKAAVDFILAKSRTDRLGILGFSMGAATSILSMAGDQRIKAGVFSSSYAKVADELREVCTRDFGLPDFPILPVAMSIANFRGNMNLYEVVPEDEIGRISPRPVFIMHCDKDDYVDYKHAGRLFSAAKEPKEMWTARCDVHEHLWNSDPKKAESLVVSFFDRYL